MMPVIFAGHGSPMNAILDNEFTRQWAATAASIPRPVAILVVSAHWLTNGTYVTAMEQPKTIHDFGGFPQQLFEVEYPAPGDPELAAYTAGLVTSTEVQLDHDWGFDHGTWSVIKHMYPKADIPVLQFSIDYRKPARYHYELGRQLKSLRSKGVLIIGSGNMVHNLRMVAWDKLDEQGYGYDWAYEMNSIFKSKLAAGDHRALCEYDKLSTAALLAVPTPDHYFPLIYAMALGDAGDEVSFFNDALVGGSLNMTSVRWGS
jgi:4,5-DOPA dioxygenase extradiol